MIGGGRGDGGGGVAEGGWVAESGRVAGDDGGGGASGRGGGGRQAGRRGWRAGGARRLIGRQEQTGGLVECGRCADAIGVAGSAGASDGSHDGLERQAYLWPSVAISGHQWPSVAISGHQWPSVAIIGHHWPSAAISALQYSRVHLVVRRVVLIDQA